MADGQVVFEIKGDNSGIKQTLSETTQAIKSETAEWEKTTDDTGNTVSGSLIGAFQKVVVSAAFVKIGKMLLDLGIESINLASDLEEVQNVVDVTFGEKGAAEIEKWAKSAAQNFGLTELQAKRYASTMGAMMKSSGMAGDEVTEMSMRVAELAADMASFYNLDFDEAFLKIQSGLSGEVEPLRRLGINMSVENLADFTAAQEDFTKPFGKMDAAEQTLIRFKYLMQATADAQGDFVRTSDSYANSQRRITTAADGLKAMLGEALLPIATQVSDAVADLLELLVNGPPPTAMEKASDSMNDAVETATKAQGIIGYLETLNEKYGAAASETDEWRMALEELKKVMPDVNQFINDETGALTATNEQLREYVANQKQAAIEEAKRKAIQDLTDQYTQASMDYYTQEVNRDIAQAQADEAVRQLIDYIVKGHTARVEAMGDEYDAESNNLYTNADELFAMFKDGTVNMQELMFEAEGVANQYGESQETLKRLEDVYNEQNKAVNAASNEMKNLQSTITDLEFDLSIAEQALQRMAEAANLNAGAGTEGSFAVGLDRVPHDNFIASLHKGETVLTAQEGELYRSVKYGNPAGSFGFDYGLLGAALGGSQRSAPVYLDGQIVGRVISDRQADSYRQLERSGWQR